jgi:hypothetical protein
MKLYLDAPRKIKSPSVATSRTINQYNQEKEVSVWLRQLTPSARSLSSITYPRVCPREAPMTTLLRSKALTQQLQYSAMRAC